MGKRPPNAGKLMTDLPTTEQTPSFPHLTSQQGPYYAPDVTMHLCLHGLPARHVSFYAEGVDCPSRRTCIVLHLPGRALSLMAYVKRCYWNGIYIMAESEPHGVSAWLISRCP